MVGVWVGQLKVALALTQLEANLIATFLFTGGCFVGPLVRGTPNRPCGARLTRTYRPRGSST